MTDQKKYIITEGTYMQHIAEKVALYYMVKRLALHARKQGVNSGNGYLSYVADEVESNAQTLFDSWGIPRTFLMTLEPEDIHELMKKELTEVNAENACSHCSANGYADPPCFEKCLDGEDCCCPYCEEEYCPGDFEVCEDCGDCPCREKCDEINAEYEDDEDEDEFIFDASVDGDYKQRLEDSVGELISSVGKLNEATYEILSSMHKLNDLAEDALDACIGEMSACDE